MQDWPKSKNRKRPEKKKIKGKFNLRKILVISFFSVVLPLSRRGYLTATVLGFAHTLGEFGVVLMVGGNIPEKTKVISIEIYDRVEVMEYAQAHLLSAILLLFSFLVLVIVYSINKKLPVQVS